MLVLKGDSIALRQVTLVGAHGVRVLHPWALPIPRGGAGFGISEMPPTGTTAR